MQPVPTCPQSHRKSRTIPSPAFTFAFLLSTLYGTLFHLWQGGDGRRLIVYILTGWSGFGLGQFIADMLNITVMSIGPVHVFSGTLGAWLGLVITRVLVPGTSRTPASKQHEK